MNTINGLPYYIGDCEYELVAGCFLLIYYSGHKIVYILDFIYWSQKIKNVDVRPFGLERLRAERFI